MDNTRKIIYRVIATYKKGDCFMRACYDPDEAEIWRGYIALNDNVSVRIEIGTI
jgi:hypothetical protein